MAFCRAIAWLSPAHVDFKVSCQLIAAKRSYSTGVFYLYLWFRHICFSLIRPSPVYQSVQTVICDSACSDRHPSSVMFSRSVIRAKAPCLGRHMYVYVVICLSLCPCHHLSITLSIPSPIYQSVHAITSLSVCPYNHPSISLSMQSPIYQSVMTIYQSVQSTTPRHHLSITPFRPSFVYQSVVTVHQSVVTVYQSVVTVHQSVVTVHQSVVTVHQSVVTVHQSCLVVILANTPGGVKRSVCRDCPSVCRDCLPVCRDCPSVCRDCPSVCRDCPSVCPGLSAHLPVVRPPRSPDPFVNAVVDRPSPARHRGGDPTLASRCLDKIDDPTQ